jgi:hypothetical protein
MLPVSLFGARSFVRSNVLPLFLYAALGALLVLMPFVLIQAAGYSATAPGAALLRTACSAFAARSSRTSASSSGSCQGRR